MKRKFQNTGRIKKYEGFLLFISIIVVLVILPGIMHAQIFTKVNSQVLLKKTNLGIGGGFIDYNNDGKPDIYVNNGNGKSLLFRNDGNDEFSEVTDDNLLPNFLSNTGLTWGDYDNDGNNDLFLASANGTVSLLHNNGNGNFLRLTDNPMSENKYDQEQCTWVDYDNDGWLDLFVSTVGNTSFTKGNGKSNYLYHNNGDGRFTKVNTSAPELIEGNNVCANFCDFDNDGDMDLFMTECELDNYLFLNNGDGTFTRINQNQFTNSYSSVACSWGDYDNDGYMDLFVANGSTATKNKYPSYLYHNNGDKTFTKITNGALAEYTGNTWNGLWADFDNDGDLDIFIGTYGEPDRFFINNGDGTFTEDTTEFDQSSTGTSGACFGDYNNDGFLDLFPANVNGTGNLLYKNNGNGNNWIFIDCEGTISNRSAIGARVKVKATIFGKSYWQIRDINGNMGFRGISELRAHFGLGDASVIDSLIIEWPSKTRTVKTGIPVNQSLKVKEDVSINYLQPRFLINTFSGFSPLEIQFTDISICNENNPITSWSWDLDGDGKEDSNEKNPTYKYYCYEGKSYNVSLTISTGSDKKKVIRDSLIQVFPLYQQNVALHQKVEVSSCSKKPVTAASSIIDGSSTTYWFSSGSDSQWVKIELDSSYVLSKIVIKWGNSFAKQYKIQCSNDGNEWSDLINIVNGNGNDDSLNFDRTGIKYLMMNLNASSNNNGYKIHEIELYRPETLTGVRDLKLTPGMFKLYQNYPNPFNPETIISYQLPVSSLVELKVFDILGREITTLVNKEQAEGNYSVKFDGTNLCSGIYLYKIKMGDCIIAKKMILMR